MSNRLSRRARSGYGYFRSDVSDRWIEVCITPDCPCYGITTHWGTNRSEHRPFTVLEIAALNVTPSQ
jgi:hypothetical protein